MKEKDSPSIESLLATTRIRPVVANAVTLGAACTVTQAKPVTFERRSSES